MSAAYGGITTLIHFIGSGNFTAWGAKPEWSLADAIQHFRGVGETASYLDFAFHAAIAQADDHLKTIPAGVALGVTSFKMFLAYKSRGMMLSDDQMLEAMETMRDSGALAMVHAESGCAIDYLEQKLIEGGRRRAEHYLSSRPNTLEEEATFRATAFARVAGCPLYVVHMSCREAIAVTTRAKAAGQAVFAETCPHYLVLTDEAVRRHGANFKIGPPLRSREDVEALWTAIREVHVDVSRAITAPTLRRRSGGGPTTSSPRPSASRFGDATSYHVPLRGPRRADCDHPFRGAARGTAGEDLRALPPQGDVAGGRRRRRGAGRSQGIYPHQREHPALPGPDTRPTKG